MMFTGKQTSEPNIYNITMVCNNHISFKATDARRIIERLRNRLYGVTRRSPTGQLKEAEAG